MAEEARGVLIDTSVLIAHFRGRLPQEALRSAILEHDSVYVSALTLYELEYGAIRAGRASDFAKIERDLRPLVLPVGREVAERAANLNGALARENQQIRPRDALIAATALEKDLALFTLNIGEFQRVPGLQLLPSP